MKAKVKPRKKMQMFDGTCKPPEDKIEMIYELTEKDIFELLRLVTGPSCDLPNRFTAKHRELGFQLIEVDNSFGGFYRLIFPGYFKKFTKKRYME